MNNLMSTIEKNTTNIRSSANTAGTINTIIIIESVQWTLKFGLAGFVSLLLSGCNSSHDNISQGSSASAVVSAASLDGYGSTIYQFGKANGCVNCHAGQVNPQWMNPDVKLAYQYARPFIDFSNPTASVFASYVSNNHCNNPICNNPSNVAVMQTLLTQWALVELQQGSSNTGSILGSSLATPSFVTGTLPIPNPLPLITTGQITVLRFNLSDLTPAVPSLSGAILEVSIQSFNSGQNEYKIFDPRIYGNPQGAIVTGLHLYVRPASGTGLGTEDVIQGARWAGVNIGVGPSAMPNPLPAGPVTSMSALTSITLGIAAQSSSDVLTIGFANIQ